MVAAAVLHAASYLLKLLMSSDSQRKFDLSMLVATMAVASEEMQEEIYSSKQS